MPLSSFQRFKQLFAHRTVRRTAKFAVGAVFLYSIVGFFILPGIIQSQAEKLIAEKLQRQATISAVEVNPFSLAITIRSFKLHEPKSKDVFASFDALHVNLSSESLIRLAPVVHEVRLNAPFVRLVREDAHRYNIDDIVQLIANQPPSDEEVRFAVNNIQVKDGRIEFDDRPAHTVHRVDEIALGIPFVSSLPSQVDIFVEPLLSAKINNAPLLFKGKARPFADPAEATLELKLDGLDVTRYVEYLPVKPQAKIAGGKMDVNLTARFRQGKGADRAFVLEGDTALKALRVADLQGKPVLQLNELAVRVREADLFRGRFDVSRVSLNGIQADVSRDAAGLLNLARLLPESSPAKPEMPATATTPITLTLGEFTLRDATVRYADDYSTQPMRASIERLETTARKLTFDNRKRELTIEEIASSNAAVVINRSDATENVQADGKAIAAAGKDRPAPESITTGTAKEADPFIVNIGRVGVQNWSLRMEDRLEREPVVTVAASINLSIRNLSTASSSRVQAELAATINKSGQAAIKGTFGMSPMHADLTLDLKTVDLLPLQPYISDRVSLRVTRANLSSTGRLQLDAAQDGTLKGGFKGDATVGNLAAVDKAGNNDFLRWKSLHAAGLDVRLSPLAVSMNEVALTDFFSRIVIDASGRINLQDIVRGAPDAAKQPTIKTATAPVPVTVKKVSLQGGRVRFTDNFIRPNYSATLSEFGGVLSGLSSDPASSATLDLRGEVNGAPLSVGGRINPLRGDLFLDVKANVRGMELAPLSAYSGKYVGYGIEKGKLSFDVAYQLENRKLTAENRLVLEQLTFGEKVESPTAMDLPVRFAVALLSDRNGVIDINLPIAGSLDDPQFSLGALIFKVIGNTLAKAVTQPFAMLGALFGGGAELSSMAFEPGQSTIPRAGEEKLQSLAKALADRPALRLDIAGHVDPEADREGMKHVVIQRKVRGLKIRDLRAAGVAVEPGSVTVSVQEYPVLLTRVYRDEKFPKPRNVLGLPKDLPVAEMEKLIIANADIDEDDLIALGNRRAQAVKTWLQQHGQVSPDRIFLVAAKIGGAKNNEPASRVDFSLR